MSTLFSHKAYFSIHNHFDSLQNIFSGRSCNSVNKWRQYPVKDYGPIRGQYPGHVITLDLLQARTTLTNYYSGPVTHLKGGRFSHDLGISVNI